VTGGLLINGAKKDCQMNIFVLPPSCV
jgi:hypothetical protein